QEREDPDEWFSRMYDLQAQFTALREQISESRVKAVIMSNLPSEYTPLKVQLRIMDDLTVAKLERCIRNNYLKELAGTGGQALLVTKVPATSRQTTTARTCKKSRSSDPQQCFRCGKSGHSRNC
ncbi:unnamed protein product, partial [Discosporangium mesarthrocarpum]